MKFTKLDLDGAWLIDLQPFTDERGAFARSFCANEFEEHGITPPVAQANLSQNPTSGTLRGMHFQVAPHQEAKLVRAVRGSIFDVIVDVRDSSPTKGQWFGAELSAENGTALYVPEGFAHGFVTLEDDTLVHYQVSEFYTPGAEQGLRWDDPAIGIDWPREPSLISGKDSAWPLLDGDA